MIFICCHQSQHFDDSHSCLFSRFFLEDQCFQQRTCTPFISQGLFWATDFAYPVPSTSTIGVGDALCVWVPCSICSKILMAGLKSVAKCRKKMHAGSKRYAKWGHILAPGNWRPNPTRPQQTRPDHNRPQQARYRGTLIVCFFIIQRQLSPLHY